jgi:hypothetical protein
MSINIKNKEADAILAELKARTGRGTTDLLLDLLRRERDRLAYDFDREIAEGRESARLLRSEWSARPIADLRPIDEILAYDENGLPC